MAAVVTRLPDRPGPPSPEPAGDSVSPLRVSLLLRNDTAILLDAGTWLVPGAVITSRIDTLTSLTRGSAAARQSDLLVVEIDHEDTAALRALEDLPTTLGTRLPIIAAVRDVSVAVTRRLLKAGVVDVLLVPFTRDDLAQALAAAQFPRDGGVPVPASGRRGDVVAIMGALGGVGASMIATQAVQMMTGDKQVLLIDLDLQRGNVAFYMNLKPKLTLADLLDAGERLDAEFLRVVAEKHQSGAWVIGAPDQFLLLDTITPEFIERLVDVAASQFDLVVLDLFGVWLEWTAAALQKADLVMLVTEMTVAGLHQARRQLDVFEANNLGDRVNVVLNRMPTTFFGGYDTRKAEAFLRVPISHALANDYPTVAEALDEGKTLGQIKIRGRLDRDVRRLVKGLTDRLAEARVAS